MRGRAPADRRATAPWWCSGSQAWGVLTPTVMAELGCRIPRVCLSSLRWGPPTPCPKSLATAFWDKGPEIRGTGRKKPPSQVCDCLLKRFILSPCPNVQRQEEYSLYIYIFIYIYKKTRNLVIMYTLQKGRIRKTEMKPNTATPMEMSYKHQRFDALAGRCRAWWAGGDPRGRGAAPPWRAGVPAPQARTNQENPKNIKPQTYSA